MKFGGASVATAEKFDEVAAIIEEKLKSCPSIIVVVSAMGSTTDELFSLAKKVHHSPPERELDMLISVGERISISLLAMALAKRGIEAKSFTGSQSGIITTADHANARIIDIRPHRLLQALGQGKVAIVAGFQGVSEKGEITTLGRGGSDTSAVAIGVAVGAEHVEFYKDVAGIYSQDPKKDPSASFLSRLNYDQAIDIVEKGAKVLQKRSVILAKHNSIPLHVLSFVSRLREECCGTFIAEEGREKPAVKRYEDATLHA